MAGGSPAIRIQEYMATLVFHQDSPMETAITTGTTAALIRADRSLASEMSRPLWRAMMIMAWVDRLASIRLRAKMSTASGLATNSPSRSLANGMMVMVNKNAKFTHS